jgi:hypothetical protein
VPSAPGFPPVCARHAVVSTAAGPVAGGGAEDKFDDDDYPAYTMGSAAQIVGTTPGFLRGLELSELLVPHRSEGGHRRYSRSQLRIAARALDNQTHLGDGTG